MTQPASATGALPCVDIHLDDLAMTGALLAGNQQLPARPADADTTVLAPARPPMSDEVVEDEEEEDGEDDEEDEDDEDDEDEDEEDGEETEDDEDEDEDDEEEEEDEDEEEERQ